MMMHLRRIIPAFALALAAAFSATPVLQAQQTPVYVDDSPFAWELFREAQQQAAVNVGEAVRLYQDILDDFALRLVPADDVSPNRFHAARLRVLNELIGDQRPGGLLERHRLMEHAEAQRLHQAGQFAQLVLTRPWTEPGLDALLRVGQRHIEAARFDAANAALDLAVRHPDLPFNPQAAAFAWYMQAVVAHYRQDAVALEDASHQVRRLAGEGHRIASALAEKLEIVIQEQPPQIPTGISPLDVGTVSPSVALEELVAEEIWSVPLSETLYQRRFVQNTRRAARRGREQAFEDGLVMTAAPTVVSGASGGSGGLVYVNQGHHIMALDRFTGSPMWPMVGGYVERPPLTIVDREDDHARDLNVLAVENDVLVTLSGHAHVSSRSNNGVVLCLNAYTGEERWTTRIDRIAGPEIDADEHEGLFPHSAPVIAEGKVFVLARKMSPQALTSKYLVALNLDDGSAAWVRHIASSGTIRRAARSISTLVYNDGDLYIKTAIGAVARVEAATGQVRWLHRFSVPLNPASAEQMRRPWELDAPVITQEYVISLLPAVPGAAGTGGQRVLVLDRRTGHEVFNFDAGQAEWGTPAYLLSAGEHSPWIYAVGREIRAVHVHALDRAVWALPYAEQDNPLEVQGRVHVVAHDRTALNAEAPPALVVPDDSGILIVDGASGQVINRLVVGDTSEHGWGEDDSTTQTGATGNPVVVDSQLFIADNERLRSFMAVHHAVGMLRDRMEADPADPDPGVALLRLAIAAGTTGTASAGDEFDLIMLAAQAVMRSIELAQSEPAARGAQSRLLSLLLAADVGAVANTAEQGEAIFAIMRQVIAAGERHGGERETHAQRLSYLLAYGDWLAEQEGGTAKAVETYRSVLTQPALAEVRRTEGEVIRPGRAWALRRLFAHGQHDEAAIAAQRRVIARPLPVIGDQNGPAVLLDGALIRRAHSNSGIDRVDDAARRLSSVMLYGDQLVRLHEVAGSSGKGDELSKRWSLDVSRAGVTDDPSGASQAWAVDHDRSVLWLEDTRSGGVPSGRFVMVHREMGRALWISPGVDALFGEVPRRFRSEGSGRAARHASRDNGRFGGGLDDMGQVDMAELLPLVGPSAAVLVRRDGGVARFDLEDGSNPAWLLSRVLEEVHHAALGDGILVLAGLAHGASAVEGRGARRHDAPAAAMVAIDLATGKFKHGSDRVILLGSESGAATPESAEAASFRGGGVNWMALDASGILVCGTETGVQAWDMTDCSFLWKNASPRARNTRRGWIAAGRVFIETREGLLRSIEMEDATIAAPMVDTSGGRTASPAYWGDVRNVMPYGVESLGSEEARVLVHCAQRIAWYDMHGNALGFDIIQDQRNFRWVLPARDRVIVVNAHQPRQQPARGSGSRRTHYVYSIYSLSDDGRLLDEPLQLPALFDPLRDAELIDGWLLMSTAAHTIAVPFPVGK